MSCLLPSSGSNIFQSTLSSRRATSGSLLLPLWMWYFNPRSPHGERRVHALCDFTVFPISIHALLTESDPEDLGPYMPNPDFNPRSPHGERQSHSVHHFCAGRFQSTLSSRRATAGARSVRPVVYLISIHALLTESDRRNSDFRVPSRLFQSTLSSRRATAPPGGTPRR